MKQLKLRKNKFGSFRLFLAICFYLAASGRGWAGPLNLPFDVSLFPNISQLISQSVADAFVSTLGYSFDLRPYQSATPLGTHPGVDLGVEITAVRITDEFRAALTTLGAGSTASSLPIIPAPRIILNKGIGEEGELGLSFLYFNDIKIWGLSGKVAVYHPDEGATWALRLNYSNATVSFVKAQVWTPEVLISRKMEFADPYVGLGYQFISGEVDAEVTGSGGSTSRYQAKGGGSSLKAFLGVALLIPNLGIKTTVEGSFHLKQAHTLGAKIGFEF